MLKRRSRQLSAESIAKDLQTSCGLQRDQGMGFHGQVPASKSYITKCNAVHGMQWCNAQCHWTL
ncbi:unnamed protein product, partial [Staurois parvus]